MKKLTMIIALMLLMQTAFGQSDEQGEKNDPPAYKMFRAAEQYNYLKDAENNPYESDYFDFLKLIPLNRSKTVNLLFGGEFRPRFEYFGNNNWSAEDAEDQAFYSQRISFHSNVNITKHIKVFAEVYHGLVSLDEEEFANSDQLALHQGFVAIKIPIADNSGMEFRLGRQEIAFGAGRLVGLREGPNIRRSFDMGRIFFKAGETKLQAFYGKEVKPSFGVFDNEFNLFDADAGNPEFWGLNAQFIIKNDIGKNELYYFGFKSPFSKFNDANSADLRHTLGLRRFGKIGQSWRYNTEIIGQLGTAGGKNVAAWAIETDWNYLFHTNALKPEIGIKLDLISGDKTAGDDRLETFNPMFTNPAYFGLAGTIAPVNLIEFHPSISIKPIEKIKTYLEWASFYRFQKADGVYGPPRFLKREAQDSSERLIGHQLGFKFDYEIDRHLTFKLDFSYFLAGGFLKETGASENITHFSSALHYKF